MHARAGARGLPLRSMNDVSGASSRMRRINVTGTSCSGKTTLARAIAARLGLPCVELDALHWEADWTEAAPEVMRDRVRDALHDRPGWVVDGNYSVTRDLVWQQVDTVVWLDYSLPVILGRFGRRTLRRIRSREELWPGTGNRETLRQHLDPRASLLWWILSTYRRRRREYPQLLASRPEIAVVRLRTPGEAQRWLAGLDR